MSQRERKKFSVFHDRMLFVDIVIFKEVKEESIIDLSYLAFYVCMCYFVRIRMLIRTCLFLPTAFPVATEIIALW